MFKVILVGAFGSLLSTAGFGLNNQKWQEITQDILAGNRLQKNFCIESFYDQLQEEYKQRFAIIPFSRAPKVTSIKKPRILLTDKYGDVFFVFNSREAHVPIPPDSEEYSVEVAAFDYNIGRYVPMVLTEEQTKQGVKLKIDASKQAVKPCGSCHGQPFRLIMDVYGNWPDSLGSVHNTYYLKDGLSSLARDFEIEAYSKELQLYKTFMSVSAAPTAEPFYKNPYLFQLGDGSLHKLSSGNTSISFIASARVAQEGLIAIRERSTDIAAQYSISQQKAIDTMVFVFGLTQERASFIDSEASFQELHEDFLKYKKRVAEGDIPTLPVPYLGVQVPKKWDERLAADLVRGMAANYEKDRKKLRTMKERYNRNLAARHQYALGMKRIFFTKKLIQSRDSHQSETYFFSFLRELNYPTARMSPTRIAYKYFNDSKSRLKPWRRARQDKTQKIPLVAGSPILSMGRYFNLEISLPLLHSQFDPKTQSYQLDRLVLRPLFDAKKEASKGEKYYMKRFDWNPN